MLAIYRLKSSGPNFDPRSLYAFDMTWKVFEMMLRPRLQYAIEAAWDLSHWQHSFRKGHSTLTDISEVVGTVQRANEACHQAWPIVILIQPNVKNTFNSPRWVFVLEALQCNFIVPDYLLVVVQDYLKGHQLTYETENGRRMKEITSRAAQRSIISPDPCLVRWLALSRDATQCIPRRLCWWCSRCHLW